MPIEYYPEIKYADYKTDNPNLYIAVEQNNDNSLNLKIIETDSQKKEKVNLPKDWNRGSGQIYDIVDKIEIKNSKIKIVQYQENGIKKELNKLLTLK